MITADKINTVIGKPFDPINYHCYHLVQELVDTVPDIDGIGVIKDSIEKFKEHKHKCDEVDEWKNGDVILLGKDEDTLYHAGVYFNNMIIHNERPSVRADSIETLQYRFPMMKGYRCK